MSRLTNKPVETHMYICVRGNRVCIIPSICPSIMNMVEQKLSMEVSSWENSRTKGRFSWEKYGTHLPLAVCPPGPSAEGCWTDLRRSLQPSCWVSHPSCTQHAQLPSKKVDPNTLKDLERRSFSQLHRVFVFLLIIIGYISSLNFDERRIFRDLHGSTVLQHPRLIYPPSIWVKLLVGGMVILPVFSLCLLYSPHRATYSSPPLRSLFLNPISSGYKYVY